jgi:hypothetical protein
LADLPIGWGADRERPELEWVREALPEDDDDDSDDA